MRAQPRRPAPPRTARGCRRGKEGKALLVLLVDLRLVGARVGDQLFYRGPVLSVEDVQHVDVQAPSPFAPAGDEGHPRVEPGVCRMTVAVQVFDRPVVDLVYQPPLAIAVGNDDVASISVPRVGCGSSRRCFRRTRSCAQRLRRSAQDRLKCMLTSAAHGA